MTSSLTRARIAAAIGAGTLAATTLGLTPGTASAAPGSTPSEVGNTFLTMTVSDTTPNVGDTITLRADFQRKVTMAHISKVKQLVPSCLTYVVGSAAWQGTPVTSVEDHPSTGAGDQAYVLAESAAWNSWKVTEGLVFKYGDEVGLTTKFVVTAACATGLPLSTSVHYTATLDSHSPQNAGPSITVATASTGGGETGGGDSGCGTDDGGSSDGGSSGGDTAEPVTTAPAAPCRADPAAARAASTSAACSDSLPPSGPAPTPARPRTPITKATPWRSHVHPGDS